jgi:hypothetical protein
MTTFARRRAEALRQRRGALEDDLNRVIAQDKRGAHALGCAPRSTKVGTRRHAPAGAIAVARARKTRNSSVCPAAELGDAPLCTVCSKPPSPDSEKVF